MDKATNQYISWALSVYSGYQYSLSERFIGWKEFGLE